jgi:hypothetical protein
MLSRNVSLFASSLIVVVFPLCAQAQGGADATEKSFQESQRAVLESQARMEAAEREKVAGPKRLDADPTPTPIPTLRVKPTAGPVDEGAEPVSQLHDISKELDK